MALTKVSKVAPPMVLSIWEKGDEANMDDSIKRNVVSGVVERVTPDAIVLDVTVQGHFKGTISPQHLSYHSGEYHPLNPLFLCNCFYCFKPLAGHAELMKSALRPGYEFDQLLVLEGHGFKPWKQPLAEMQDIDGSYFIPSAKHSLVTSAQQLPLDINQVRLNSVLHATYDRRSSLSEVYQIGQSVRTNVVDVNSETSRITVSLKQSFCSSTDASFIQEYFLVEKISKLQSVDSGGSDLRWVEQFNLGCTVKGKVHEIKEFGVVVGFQKLSGIPVETGSSIRTAVLDVSKIERLVDLSLKPVFVDKSKKETTNSQTQKVVSVPSYNYTLGYASRADYNTPNFPPKSFTNGESLEFLWYLSCNENCEVVDLGPNSTPKASSRYKDCPIHASDDNYTEAPFSNFRFEQTLTARIISKFNMSESVNRVYQWELSIKPSILAGSGEIEPVKKFSYSTGQLVSGFVYEVDSEWAWLTISRDIQGVTDPLSGYHEGQFVKCKVLEIAYSGKGTVHIDLSLRSISHKTQKQKLSALNDTVLDGKNYLMSPTGGRWKVSVELVKVDKERHRISLGMKKSYFNDATSTETDARPSSGYTVNGDALSIGIESTPSPEKSSQAREDFDGESVDGKDLFLAEVESRASIPPLDVPLDDTENFDMGDVVNETQYLPLNPIFLITPQEAVAKVFQRALQYCDPKKVHLALLGMYERTEQHKLTDELLNKMVKKFKHSCKVWLRRVQWLLKQNQDGVQSVANRALLSLPPHKDIIFITQTAILEFKCGVPDRGCSLFEKMLREYPKRTDLWSVYLDQQSWNILTWFTVLHSAGEQIITWYCLEITLRLKLCCLGRTNMTTCGYNLLKVMSPALEPTSLVGQVSGSRERYGVVFVRERLSPNVGLLGVNLDLVELQLAYQLWIERNNRRFNSKKKSHKLLLRDIVLQQSYQSYQCIPPEKLPCPQGEKKETVCSPLSLIPKMQTFQVCSDDLGQTCLHKDSIGLFLGEFVVQNLEDECLEVMIVGVLVNEMTEN
ncbi:hypothetical protein FXO37_33419 [Capsicum annuum]|nr:hypothetical protein FXO37_33419 [Capsicum annuum]